MREYIKIGVAGPVGSGKTALIEKLTRHMAQEYSIAVITNDIYTQEDAEFLTKNSLLPPERIMGVETGGCPHTAIREDASMNLEAVDEMTARFPDIQILSALIWLMLRCLLLMWRREKKFRAKADRVLPVLICWLSIKLI